MNTNNHEINFSIASAPTLTVYINHRFYGRRSGLPLIIGSYMYRRHCFQASILYILVSFNLNSMCLRADKSKLQIETEPINLEPWNTERLLRNNIIHFSFLF